MVKLTSYLNLQTLITYTPVIILAPWCVWCTFNISSTIMFQVLSCLIYFRYIVTLDSYFPTTMAPNGSEFSHRVWILFFIFYFLVLSFQISTESYCIVLMYIYIILLRNTKSQKVIAGMIRQWFWYKYFACTFRLYYKCSEKNDRLPILYSCILALSS